MVMTIGIEPAPAASRAPSRRAARGAHHDAGDPMLAHGAQHLGLALEVLVGVGEDGHEAELVERLLDADGEFGEEGVRQVADDHADEVGARGAQIRRAAVVDVAELLDDLLDAARASRP